MDHTDAGNCPLGIMHALIIAGQRIGPAKADEDILAIRRNVHQIGSRILIRFTHEVNYTDRKVTERVDDLDVVAEGEQPTGPATGNRYDRASITATNKTASESTSATRGSQAAIVRMV